jgi:hypothetical protein
VAVGGSTVSLGAGARKWLPMMLALIRVENIPIKKGFINGTISFGFF